MIDFAEPGNFVLLLVVAAMTGAAIWLMRWRQRARESFAGPQAAGWQSTPWGLRMILMLMAAAVIVVAIARPQWGSKERISQQQGIDLVIALDVSQSMLGTDAEPTRLRLAQNEVNRLIASMRGNRIGLVFFAGTAAVRAPLTTDTLALTELVERAGRENSLTRAGSDFAGAFQLSELVLASNEGTGGRAVLLISDGEDHSNAYTERAKALRDKGVVIFTAGVGTARGSQLFDVDPVGRQRPKLDAAGRPVITRLDEARLRAIAQNNGGRYIHLDGGGGSGLLTIRDDLSRLEQSTFGERAERLPIERFQPFVVAALILLVESWLLPASVVWPTLRRFGRIRAQPGIALVLLAIFIGACSSDPMRERNGDANTLYNRGEHKAALESYQGLLAERPDIPELSYNTGNTLHRLGEYERAVIETQRALPATTSKLGSQTYYALGNHLLALDRLEEAYDAYKSALLLSPSDADAKHNLEVVITRLTGTGQGPQLGSGPGEETQPQPGGQQPAPGQPEQQAPQAPGGTEAPSDTPPPPDAPTAEQRRALEEALKGLNEDITFEEANRILDLLREQQNQQRGGGARPTTTGPDY